MIGQTLSHYKIIEKIGQGGMGEVYLAEDSRLDRKVALKILPQHLSERAELRERFEREARAVSSLNHPHICTLYDIGEQDGIHYLVMEHLVGETLEARLAKGALPLEQTLEYAIQIADALDKAHRQGVVHRDLKPANIMLVKSGAKLLDFGLAKLQAADTPTNLSALPTEQANLTAEGTILGTLQYMAPEQLEGKEADGRTDIFAFGAVVYEMATGKKAFEGKSQASLIAAILKDDPPPMSELQPMTPSTLDHVVRRCMAKESDKRWQSASDVMEELRWVTEVGTSADSLPTVATPAAWKKAIPWSIVAVLAVITAVMSWSDSPVIPSTARVIVALPSEQELSLGEEGVVNPIALSPDGQLLVYAAAQRGSTTPRLFLRPIDQFIVRPIEGTESARAPFFSPDGRWIGFFANGTLQKVSVSGGLPVKICDTSLLFPSASWGPDDTIIFSHLTFGLYKVSASGGTPEPLTIPNAAKGEFRHHTPQILPGGRDVLFTIDSNNGPLTAILSLASNEWRTVLDNAESARYVQAGHLVFAQSGALLAVHFDLARLDTRGSSVPILERVSHLAGLGGAHFAVSDTGTLAYRPADSGATNTTLVWVNRQGRATPIVDDPAPYAAPHVSPDGRQIAVTVTPDIWVYDVERGTGRRLTTDGYNLAPVWDPDGDRLTFSAVRADPAAFFDLHSVPADRLTGPELLMTRESRQFPSSWTPDGKVLSFFETTAAGADIGILEGGKASSLLAGQYNEHSPMFSPDGRWLAYVSDESGEEEVYVRRYPGPAGSQLISVNGGREPVWSRDGRELFYRRDDLLMVVPVESTDSILTTLPPQVLFKGPYSSRFVRGSGLVGYDVAPDGQRFVMLQHPDPASSQINVVLNWFEELKRLVPTDN